MEYSPQDSLNVASLPKIRSYIDWLNNNGAIMDKV